METARALGADVVIAVEVGASTMVPARPDNVRAMISRITDVPLQRNTGISRKLADLVIQPDLPSYASTDFGRGAEMISRGYEATMAQAEPLRRWALPEAEYEEWARRHDAAPAPAPMIDEIEIAAVPGLDVRRVARLVQTKPGRLDVHALEQDLKCIYALDLFEIITYSIPRRRTASRSCASPPSPRRGAGLSASGSEARHRPQRMSSAGAVVLIDATELNRLGAEWKTTVRIGSPWRLRTRLYQPLMRSGSVFISLPRFAGTQVLRDVFEREIDVETYRIIGALGGIDLRVDFGTWAELKVGYEARLAKDEGASEASRSPTRTSTAARSSEDLTVDRLDDANLPRSGVFANLHFAATREALGASVAYDRLEGKITAVHTRARAGPGWSRLSAGDGLGTQIRSTTTSSSAACFICPAGLPDRSATARTDSDRSRSIAA